MARRLVILGTSVALPDPGSVTALAASFREVSGHLADLGGTLQALSRPDAWGEWTGQAADAFGQSIGQLPGDLGDVRDANVQAASALQRYAGQLEPVVNALASLSFQAEDAEGTLTAVKNAHAQAIAHGQNTAITGWDARLADASEAVAALRVRLARLLAELTALATACARQIAAAEPKHPKKSLLGSLASDFRKDVADPLGRAFAAAGRGLESAGRAVLEADVEELALGTVTAVDVVDAILVHPVTDFVDDAVSLKDHGFSAVTFGHALGDVAGILGVLAFVPGVDVFAIPALAVVSVAAAATDWVAVARHDQGASVMDAATATLSAGLGGVSFVAGRAVRADAGLFQGSYDAGDLDGLEALKNGTDARASGSALWKAGLPRSFSMTDVKSAMTESLDTPHNPVTQLLRTEDDGLTHSPAAVTIDRIGRWADRANSSMSTVQDARNHEVKAS